MTELAALFTSDQQTNRASGILVHGPTYISKNSIHPQQNSTNYFASTEIDSIHLHV